MAEGEGVRGAVTVPVHETKTRREEREWPGKRASVRVWEGASDGSGPSGGDIARDAPLSFSGGASRVWFGMVIPTVMGQEVGFLGG